MEGGGGGWQEGASGACVEVVVGGWCREMSAQPFVGGVVGVVV